MAAVRLNLEVVALVSRLVQDLGWGARWGVFTGAFFSLIALCIFFLAGPEPFEKAGTTLAGTLSMHFVGGLLSGVLLGLLWRWTKTRWGAMLTGILIVMPFAAVVIASLEGPIHMWGAREIFGVIGTSVILGSMGGWELWKLWGDQIRRRFSHGRS